MSKDAYQEPVKTCPKCGGEYAPHGLVCADCGGALVVKREVTEPSQPTGKEEESVLLREGRLDYLKDLSRLLSKERIGSLVVPRSDPKACAGATVYGLLVSPGNVDAAREIDRALWLKGAPEHASSYRYTEQELGGTCPACGTALPEQSPECPECGLAVGSVESAECPACDTDVPADAEKCPNCGAEFE
jgi:predicted amidophosphoribosyltransferase